MFYHLQILKRKKENPDLGSNARVIKTYYISSIDYLENKMDEIVSLCGLHNARAYINLNRRSYKTMAFQTLKKVTNQIMGGDYRACRKAYESVCGTYSAAKEDKSWIIDIDYDDDVVEDLVEMENVISELILETNREPNIWMVPTKNGVHYITQPFNLKQFREEYPDIEVHKNNPTILYC